eukprot:jgi/Undpi1/2734/HiC_scaffold_14.g06112.m1
MYAGALSSSWKRGANLCVKHEGVKRSAANFVADRSDDVQVTSKPKEEVDTFSRPAKRGKGPSEEDVEMMGKKGVDLPHNRFSCTEHPFDCTKHASGSHANRCTLCFCYVCNRPATGCMKWKEDHCHALDSGPLKLMWKNLRHRAKAALKRGRVVPVSGLYKGTGGGPFSHPPSRPAVVSPSPPSSRSRVGAASAATLAAKPSPTAHLPNDCNCKELCQLVHKIFKFREQEMDYLGGKVPVVYLKGLTNAEVVHVQDTAVLSTVKRLAEKRHPASSHTYQLHPELRNVHIERDIKRWMPYVYKGDPTRRVRLLKSPDPTCKISSTRTRPDSTGDLLKAFCADAQVVAGADKFDVMVASSGADRFDGQPQPAPWLSRWKPPHTVPGSVRLGGISGLDFNLTTCGRVMPLERRQSYFDHYITKNPLPISVWFAVQDSIIIDRESPGELTMRTDDHRIFLAGSDGKAHAVTNYSGVGVVKATLIKCLAKAHANQMIHAKLKATYDASTNDGEISVEVLLLAKVFNRGMSMKNRSVDFVTIVNRLAVPNEGSSPPSSSSSSSCSSCRPSSSPGVLQSSSCSNVAAAGGALVAGSAVPSPGRVGQKFTASAKGYGGHASLDVSMSGLMKSVLAEEDNELIGLHSLFTPAKLLREMENLQHRALIEQPDCLTVQLYEHQMQGTQWMYDQEMLEGGSKRHLWAELPAHPDAPSNGPRFREFRKCWFSPVLNQFTDVNPFISGMKGGILCDEMGLGKTAATLALHLVNPAKTPSEGVPLDENEWGTISGAQATALACAKSSVFRTEEPGSVVSKGTLVVCKLSLVGQWVEEAKRLCGGVLSIYPYHGGNRKKDPNFLAKFDIVVTTYGVVQADASRNKGFPPLRRIRWWRVALDESHTIANTTGAAKVVNQLIANRRWCITGTPYVSKFSDVNGQLGFIGLGGAFNAPDFGDQRPNTDTQGATLALLRRVLLRHSQGMSLGGRSILGLPTISHKVEQLTLPPKERQAYDDLEKSVQSDFIAVRHRLLHMSGSHTMEVLTLLSKFRQACSGGQLMIGQSGESGSSASCLDAFCPMCNELLESPARTPCGHVFCQACITSALTQGRDAKRPCPKCKKFNVGLDDLVLVGKGVESSSSSSEARGSSSSGYRAKSEPQKGSGGGGSDAREPGVVMETKLKALVAKLSAIHVKDPTSKSLVFSQFNSSLDWLKRSLPKLGFQFRTLTGNMSRTQRTNALKAFANDPPTTVFLLSVRSGAVGINLTQANNVFLLEPLLNLALEKQAIGRVYRLGQSRPVTVTKLVLKDSIETRILDLQKRQANTSAPSSSAGAGSSSSGVAGNISKDSAKNLKIEEYNTLFGVYGGYHAADGQYDSEDYDGDY